MRYSIEAQEKLKNSRHKRWVSRAKSLYGDRFSYSRTLSTFSTQKGSKVEIACMRHKFSFMVFPDKHLQNAFGGCEKCERDHLRNASIKKAKQKFLPWFKKNYSHRLMLRSDLGLLTDPVEVECLKHGVTKSIKPTVLMTTDSHGCDMCAREATALAGRLDLDVIRRDVNANIPDGLSLKEVYFNELCGRTELVFECGIHGIQAPVRFGHVKRSDAVCLDCGKLQKGYSSYRLRQLIDKGSSGRKTTIGVMELEVFGIRGLKVGITTRSLEERYSYYLNEIYFAAELAEIDAIVLENRIKLHFSDHRDERILKAGMRQGERWSGDTEFFWKRKKSEIIEYIQSYLSDGTKEPRDYLPDLRRIESSVLEPSKVKRQKSSANKPIAVIGIDPRTEQVKEEFASLAEAARHGYRNISQVLSSADDRQFSGGLRWFKKEGFNSEKIPPLIRKVRGKPFRCVQTNEIFMTTAEAEMVMRERGKKVSASKITSVLNGHRNIAGGYSWARVDPESKEVRDLLKRI